jgi:hypothetical protein
MDEFENAEHRGKEILREHHAAKGDISLLQGAIALAIVIGAIVVFAWVAGIPLIG